MKKLFLSLSILIVATVGYSQTLFQVGTAKSVLATNGLARDSVQNTNSETWPIKVSGDASATVSFVVNITKISGTLGGTMVVQASNDGTNWADIGTAYTVTDGNQAKSFQFDLSHYTFYQVKWTGTGTMLGSAIVQANVKKRSF